MKVGYPWMAAVSGPRSTSSTFKPWRRASAPMARPVGPAPTTIRSRISFISLAPSSSFLARARVPARKQPVEMVHRAVPARSPYRIRGGEGPRQILDRSRRRPRQLLPRRQPRGEGGGEGAAGAVGRGAGEPGVMEALDPVVARCPGDQEVDDL